MHSVENDAGAWGDFTRKCARCGQTYGGSHYHCGACDSLDVTGMYGHHSTRCKRTGGNREFHHCGPDGCSLGAAPIPPDLCPTCRETLPCLTCGAGL